MKITKTNCRFNGTAFEAIVVVEDEGKQSEGRGVDHSPKAAAHQALSHAIKTFSDGLHQSLNVSVNIQF